MMKSGWYGDDRGFSLVELIVVVLIVAILATTATISLSIVINADTEKAAKKFCTMMSTARAKAMATDGEKSGSDVLHIVFRVFVKDGNNYAGIYKYDEHGNLKETIEEEKLSNYKVNIIVGPQNSETQPSAMKQLDESDTDRNYAEYRFRKSSGGIDSVKLGAGAAETDSSSTNLKFYTDVIFDGSETFKAIIVPGTGRCYLEN